VTVNLPLLNSENESTRAVGYIIYAFLAINALFFIIGLISIDSEHKDSNTANVEGQKLTDKDIERMLPEDVDAKAISVYDGGEVNITILEGMFSDRPGKIRIAGKMSTEIFRALFKDPRIKKVTVSSATINTDVGSEPRLGAVLTVTMTAETARKIDWDTFDYTYLKSEADYYVVDKYFRLGL
jgi:hypothetical protein